MLYLNPPYHIIEGVSLFPDHADPRQYYYLPLRPRLTARPDPESEQNVPQLQLIEYRGEAGSGGFLNFDVNLGVEEDVLEEVRGQLQALEDLEDAPRLAPVPLVDGNVRLILLGKESDQEPDGEDGEGPQFVLKIDHAAKPALYGDNQAAFSVELDEAGVTVLKEALEGQMTPIGVVYSLEYLALRPAYAVKIRADWERIQEHFEKRFSGGLLFSSVEIGEVIDELIENQDLVIEIDTFVPEDEAGGLITRRDEAVEEVKEMLLQTFFEPTLEPEREEEDGWDRLLHVAERSSLLAATGGWGGIAQFSYKKVDLTRVDRKRLAVNMRERTTVRRSVFPQGHLQGLAQVIRDSSLSLDDFIVSATLDDPWFQRRRVEVISRANFETDAISSLNVTLRYGDDQTNVILEEPDARQAVEWPSILEDGAMQRDVTYRYQVTFADVDTTDRPQRLESEEQIFPNEELEVNPRAEELYYMVDVPIVADIGFPWERYPQVEVQTRYTDEENGIHQHDTFRVEEESQDTVWKQFVLNPEETEYQYRITYHGADHKDVEKGWATQDQGEIRLEDPFPQKRKLLILPALNWDEVSMAMVSIRYEDPANDVRVEENIQFAQADGATAQEFTADLVDPEQRLVSYKAVIIFNDGRVRELPRSTTFDTQVIITPDMRGHRVIDVQPEDVSFDQEDVDAIKVDLHFEDPDAGLSFADTTTFRSRQDHFYFEYDYADEEETEYQYRATYRFTNGMSRTTDWKRADKTPLRLPVG